MLALKAGSLPPQAVLHGRAGTNPWSLPVSLQYVTSHGGLSVFWARQKISALMDETYKGGLEEAIRRSVLDVALAHHLVSQYTSLVAVDVMPARPTDTPAAEQDQAMNLASAQEQNSLAGLPRTATSGQLQILSGLTMLMLAWWLWRLRREAA